MKTEKKPLSIYIHIPFCLRKCLYCDFLSAPATEENREKYLNALLQEMNRFCENHPLQNYEVISVFFGGGTPSLMKAGQVQRILDKIYRHFDVREDVEISLECNPKTADLSKLQGYYGAGVNRLSIGLQSADNQELLRLGRLHSYEEFLETYEFARKTGFQNINIDLMAAIPGQTIHSWRNTLSKVLELEPEHISAYQLIVEEGTPFFEMYGDSQKNKAGYHGKYASVYAELPDEDTEREMYYLTKELLEQHEYYRYEISNYSKKGYECRHNISYWTGVDYIGFGLGASSYFQGRRYHCVRDLQKYCGLCRTGDNEIYEEIQLLSRKERMEEFMFLGLRMIQGVSSREFLDRFGVDIQEIYRPVLDRMESLGLLIFDKENERVYLTDRGLDVANYVMSDFLLDD